MIQVTSRGFHTVLIVGDGDRWKDLIIFFSSSLLAKLFEARADGLIRLAKAISI